MPAIVRGAQVLPGKPALIPDMEVPATERGWGGVAYSEHRGPWQGDFLVQAIPGPAVCKSAVSESCEPFIQLYR